MKKSLIPIALSLMLGATALQAVAAVEVEFVKPDQFVDIGNRWGGLRDVEDGIKNVKAALTERGEAVLKPGQDMKIMVTAVDLAGDVHPFGRSMEMIRVVKPVYRPSMEFSYVITEGGKTVREGKADINDMNFMDRFNQYFSGDALRYEKPMLDEWFSKEFGVPIKPIRK